MLKHEYKKQKLNDNQIPIEHLLKNTSISIKPQLTNIINTIHVTQSQNSVVGNDFLSTIDNKIQKSQRALEAIKKELSSIQTKSIDKIKTNYKNRENTLPQVPQIKIANRRATKTFFDEIQPESKQSQSSSQRIQEVITSIQNLNEKKNLEHDQTENTARFASEKYNSMSRKSIKLLIDNHNDPITDMLQNFLEIYLKEELQGQPNYSKIDNKMDLLQQRIDQVRQKVKMQLTAQKSEAQSNEFNNFISINSQEDEIDKILNSEFSSNMLNGQQN